jgi:N-acyl-D-aspartate/D-glutamate deacylase
VPDHDLVIRGGTVVDGTGSDPRTADVAVSGGVVTAVGRIDGAAARELDADGLLVTPGFVDIHCHYDGQATWDDRLVPSTWHGVTTIVSGNCGVGFAPVRPADHDRLIELMEGVEDIPGTALHEGLSWTWQSFAEFLDALEQRTFDADIAMQVPHAAVRLHVMGERGAAGEPATADDIVAMGAIARAGVEAGALGFTTSRTRNHRTSRGEYTPTLRAEAAELVGIAEAIGLSGQGVLQVVSDFLDPEIEFAMLRDMVVQSGRPLSFSLVQSPLRAGGDEGWRTLLQLLERARADGLPITAQVATRGIGLLLGLQCTLHPFRGNPVFAEIADRPPAEQARAMADPDLRARVLDADRANDGRSGLSRLLTWERVFELGDPPDYEPPPSASLAARAKAHGVEPAALAYDHLADGGGESLLYSPIFNYADGDLGAVREMLTHQYAVVGLADGGAHVGTICDASFPTTLLAHWGRDRAEGQLPLPFLVRRQTFDTARTVGLDDRGVLAPGYRADLNLIDHERLAARRPVARRDLPAGGTRLVQAADGYVATIVGGEVTYEEGEATGALPGRLVRGARPAPAGGGR